MGRRKMSKEDLEKRWRSLVSAVNSGETQEAAALQYGVSRQRVSQIMRGFGHYRAQEIKTLFQGRKTEAARLVSCGLTHKEIAKKLGLAESTLRSYDLPPRTLTCPICSSHYEARRSEKTCKECRPYSRSLTMCLTVLRGCPQIAPAITRFIETLNGHGGKSSEKEI